MGGGGSRKGDEVSHGREKGGWGSQRVGQRQEMKEERKQTMLKEGKLCYWFSLGSCVEKCQVAFGHVGYKQ